MLKITAGLLAALLVSGCMVTVAEEPPTKSAPTYDDRSRVKTDRLRRAPVPVTAPLLARCTRAEAYAIARNGKGVGRRCANAQAPRVQEAADAGRAYRHLTENIQTLKEDRRRIEARLKSLPKGPSERRRNLRARLQETELRIDKLQNRRARFDVPY